MVEIVVKRLFGLTAMAWNFRRAPFLALLKSIDAPAITPDAAGEMREMDFERRQIVKQAGIDDTHCCRHQREFPAQHAAKIVGVHAVPADHPRQRMNENIKSDQRKFSRTALNLQRQRLIL
jgi:hypothetical protein